MDGASKTVRDELFPQALTTSAILAIARRHAGAPRPTQGSAKVALADAEALTAGKFAGDPLFEEYARRRALTSLRYSVGIFHPDYARVAAEVER